MDLSALQEALVGLPIGPIRYHECISSTNVEATDWADRGAPDMAMVIADEQIAGKGRHGRKWHTAPGASLAFSLVLKHIEPITSHSVKGDTDREIIPRITALGALAVSKALEAKYNLIPQIKWPNDVLLNGCKIAGILTETHWQGDLLICAILGIGVNVGLKSVPPENESIFPATSVQAALGQPVSRLVLLRSILEQILEWRNRLAQSEFLKAWEELLAFRNEWVNIFTEPECTNHEIHQGLVLGLDKLGGLRLRDRTGKEKVVYMGEIQLRPVEHRFDSNLNSGEPDDVR